MKFYRLLGLKRKYTLQSMLTVLFMIASTTFVTTPQAVAKESITVSADTKTLGVKGYLNGSSIDLVQILPPAPAQGSPLYEADRLIFKQTRKLLATTRGRQAIEDVREDIPTMLANFSEAAGRKLTPENVPILASILMRMRQDVATNVTTAKNVWQRKRPFLIDKGEICQPHEEVNSYDYPSGHTTWGTSVALVLAELIPERATQILERGKSYGDSRYICGVHNLSAVEGGRFAGASIVAYLHSKPAFRHDIDLARKELSE